MKLSPIIATGLAAATLAATLAPNAAACARQTPGTAPSSAVRTESGLAITNLRLTCHKLTYRAVHPQGEHGATSVTQPGNNVAGPFILASVDGYRSPFRVTVNHLHYGQTFRITVAGREDGDSIRAYYVVPKCGTVVTAPIEIRR